MKKALLLSIIFLFYTFTFAQVLQSEKTIVNKKLLINQSDVTSINPINNSKILSGKLVSNVSEKNYLYKKNLSEATNSLNVEIPVEIVAIYMDHYPSTDEIAQLQSENIKCYPESWIPPLANHTRGFFLAGMPINKINQALSFAFVKKMDTAEYENYPQNNFGTAAINADDVWNLGYDGTGVKVAILDSGVDTTYAGTELPSSFEKEDYWNYPTTTDYNVANITSGHGTHVTGSVLGRGFYSAGRTDDGNGSEPFTGSAPGADLVFLKIGGDATSSSTSEAMIGAMQAAVNIYDADLLSMSYGGWYAHHDGSSATEQTVDWVYSMGKPFFISAGNSAADQTHYSGTVDANDTTDFIQVTAPSGGTLTYNLVWFDGLGTTNDLIMKYYNSSHVELTNTTHYTTTESNRGTESKYSLYNLTVASGTYYVKVINFSGNNQDFHIYFDNYGYGTTIFVNPDPFYTIGQPASADNGFAVGAFVTRTEWYPPTGGSYWYGNSSTDIIAPFSSRGPRVNGGVTKPNITSPGTAIISLRDQQVYTVVGTAWIDNDGVAGGNANYYVNQGTSMATPLCAGAAALLLEKNPSATPQNIYDAIENTAASNINTGFLPNGTWGNGILDILAASNSSLLPVELVSFTGISKNNFVELNWATATEVTNYGFDVERKVKSDENTDWLKIGFIRGAGNSNSPKQYSFIDKNPENENLFEYRLKQIDNSGDFKYSSSIEVALSSPNQFELGQNYPNPFNPVTSIKYSIAKVSFVTIKIYNTIGEEQVTLVNSEKQPGNYKVDFNASNLASGMYIYQLNAGDFISTKKMLLLK